MGEHRRARLCYEPIALPLPVYTNIYLYSLYVCRCPLLTGIGGAGLCTPVPLLSLFIPITPLVPGPSARMHVPYLRAHYRLRSLGFFLSAPALAL